MLDEFEKKKTQIIQTSPFQWNSSKYFHSREKIKASQKYKARGFFCENLLNIPCPTNI